ncbi:Acyl-coenzyme A thioesterase 2, mitochondrial [Cricetulus griseus]|uniref:Acyl-coenzyme A thioesterase 2, mitochondrial n=1 Tax=Cricetulus griseus TaxID=10029 RepID=G3HNG6_CRIGR|nr:Acyl-coenzyme A thioesterase 2, mitochondrial [Cricetulus griseus]
MVHIVSLKPAGRSCWDEPLGISVHGLAPEQPVTLRAALRDEKGALFRAHARYRADDHGGLDLARAPALGGSFAGIEPMGLLGWKPGMLQGCSAWAPSSLSPALFTGPLEVKGPGIGLLGISRGGELCLSMASFLKGITAAVIINGSATNIVGKLCYKDETLPPLRVNADRIRVTKDGLSDISDVLSWPIEGPEQKSIIPVERSDTTFLLLVGQDDRNWKSEFYANEIFKRLEAHGKGKPQIIYYPETGHYIEPPYFPLCKASLHTYFGMPVVFGGEPRAHAMAQVDAWQKLQTFLGLSPAHESIRDEALPPQRPGEASSKGKRWTLLKAKAYFQGLSAKGRRPPGAGKKQSEQVPCTQLETATVTVGRSLEISRWADSSEQLSSGNTLVWCSGLAVSREHLWREGAFPA